MKNRLVSNRPNFKVKTRRSRPGDYSFLDGERLYRAQYKNRGVWQDVTPLMDEEAKDKWLTEQGYEPIKHYGKEFEISELKKFVFGKMEGGLTFRQIFGFENELH